MRMAYKRVLRVSLILTFMLRMAVQTGLGAVPLPTFDFTNFTQAVESLVKAVEFYNSSISQAKRQVNQIEALSKGLASGDFNYIADSISGMLDLAAKTGKEIDGIIEYCSRKREEAEVKSKMATLEIIAIMTNPSLKGIKDYAQKRNFDDLTASEQIKRIAQDTKNALDMMINDHSESAKKAMDELDISLDSLSKKLYDAMSSVSKAIGDNSGNISALESLSSLNERCLTLSEAVNEASRLAKEAKMRLTDTDSELKDESQRWGGILKKIEDNIRNAKALNSSIKTF